MMDISLRYTGVVLLLALFAASAGTPAFSGVKKKHHAAQQRHHSKQQAVAEAPAVIDTSCIDTADLAHQQIVREINRWSSVRYKKGGITHKGADCSGFVLKVFENSLTLQLPRTSREQATQGEEVDQDDLRFGDLVFFYRSVKKKTRRIGHVGIYIGDGYFVHSSKHKGVGVDALSEHYYTRHFAVARRVADLSAPGSDPASGASDE